MHNIDKYELSITISDEKELFFSALDPMHDLETGCIWHLRADFGRNAQSLLNIGFGICVDFCFVPMLRGIKRTLGSMASWRWATRL